MNATPSGSFFLKPPFRRVGIRKDLEVIGAANRLAGVDVDKDCHLTILVMQ
jgi:hypothetical protein